MLSRCCISSTFTFKSNLFHAPTSLLNLPISFAILQHLRQHYAYFQTKATSEMCLTSSLHSSKISKLTTSPCDTNLDSTRTCHTQTPSHLDPASLIALTLLPLVNGFGKPTTGISPTASHVARYLISQTLC